MMAQYPDRPSARGAGGCELLSEGSGEPGVIAARIARMRVDEVDMRVDDDKVRPRMELVAEGRQGPEAEPRQVVQEIGIDPIPGRHQHGHETSAMEVGQSGEARRKIVQYGRARPMRTKL